MMGVAALLSCVALIAGPAPGDAGTPIESPGDVEPPTPPPADEPPPADPPAPPVSFSAHTEAVSLAAAPAEAPEIGASDVVLVAHDVAPVPREVVFAWDFGAQTARAVITSDPKEPRFGRVSLPVGISARKVVSLRLCLDDSCDTTSAPRYFTVRATSPKRGLLEPYVRHQRQVSPVAPGRPQVNRFRKLVLRLPATAATDDWVTVKLAKDGAAVERKLPTPCAEVKLERKRRRIRSNEGEGGGETGPQYKVLEPVVAKARPRTDSAKHSITRPYSATAAVDEGGGVAAVPHCVVVDLDVLEKELADFQHGERVAFEVQWKDLHGEGTDRVLTRRLRPVTPYGMFGKDWSFWIPVGVLATNFQPLSRRRGVPIGILPIGLASGAKFHVSRGFYVGASALASWTIRPAGEELSTTGEPYPGGATEVEPSATPGGGSAKFPDDEDRSTGNVKRFNLGALTVGGIVDVGNYVYVGGGYSWDWTAQVHSAGVFIFGLGPGVLELLKKGKRE